MKSTPFEYRGEEPFAKKLDECGKTWIYTNQNPETKSQTLHHISTRPDFVVFDGKGDLVFVDVKNWLRGVETNRKKGEYSLDNGEWSKWSKLWALTRVRFWVWIWIDEGTGYAISGSMIKQIGKTGNKHVTVTDKKIVFELNTDTNHFKHTVDDFINKVLFRVRKKKKRR